MSDKHDKFKKYWESLGKPALETKPSSNGIDSFRPVGAPEWIYGQDYRIAGDPHWKLRRDWINSDFTLPIAVKIGANWEMATIHAWDKSSEYRAAEQPPTQQISDATWSDVNPDCLSEVVLIQDEVGELGVNHPMYPIFMDAIEQATGGKGQRHGGARTPFLEQRWHRIAQSTGFRSLVYQMCKKAEEACGKEKYEDFERELLGALVYGAMSLIHVRKHGYTKEVKVDG